MGINTMNKRTAKRLKAMPGIIMAAAVFTGIMPAGSTIADAKPSVKLDGDGILAPFYR